ncbi:MAG: S41 family peptidase [Candidatus Atribacteria bacterium]|nr:S41 family peptidase [Candidatus Atribacteria bacterium]
MELWNWGIGKFTVHYKFGVNPLQKRKLIFWIALVVVISGLVWVTAVQANRSGPDYTGEINADKWQPFLQTIYLLKNESYSEKQIDENAMMEEAIRGVLKSTGDPYARYLNEEDFKIETSDRIEGEFSGLGIVITMKDDKLVIISPYQGSPAAKAGVKAGDVIIEIDGESTAGMPIDGAVRRLRGKKGTQVVIKLQREGVKDLFSATVTRDIVKIKSVECELLEPGIGLLRVIEYHGRTNIEMEEAIKQLDILEAKGLIIDLRNNPGGLLSTAIMSAGLFLPLNTPSLIIEDRDGKRETLKNPVNKICDKPFVILINKGTASGAEIMAGVLRVKLNAELIGETTFGKGVVQQIFPLSPRGGVIFTISKYLLPDGTDINGKGIKPDITITKDEEQMNTALKELKRLMNEKGKTVQK